MVEPVKSATKAEITIVGWVNEVPSVKNAQCHNPAIKFRRFKDAVDRRLGETDEQCTGGATDYDAGESFFLTPLLP